VAWCQCDIIEKRKRKGKIGRKGKRKKEMAKEYKYKGKRGSKGVGGGIKRYREESIGAITLGKEKEYYAYRAMAAKEKRNEKLAEMTRGLVKSGATWNAEMNRELEEWVLKETTKDWKTYFPSFVVRVAPYIQVTRYHLFLMLMYQVAYEQACEKGKQVVMALSCPPQTGKTEITSLFADFLALKYPDENVLMFSYGYVHAVRIGRKMLDIVNNVCGEFGYNVAKDKRAMNNFGFENKRGGVEVMGIDGTSTGVGGVFKFCDDPLKDDEEAGNATIRNKKWEFIEDKIMTRHRYLPNGGNITIYIMTRRHQDDPIGKLDKMWITKEMAEDGIAHKYCEYIRIPFLCDDERNDPLGRKLGEPLDPKAPRERGLGMENAKYIQATLSAKRWQSQYQQKPVLESGNLVKREWFGWYDERTKPMMFQKIVLSCDLSSEGKAKSDMSAFTVWGKDGENHYLLDFSEGRWGFSSQMAIIEKYCELYNIDKVIIEKRATGTAMIDYLRERIRTNIVGFEPKFSTKEDRLDSVEPYFTGGHVFIPTEKMKPKVETVYLDEMLAFPRGSQDGLVDTTSQYLMEDRNAKGGKIITKQEDLQFYKMINSAIRRRS